jgi:hypothetical protein
MPPLEIYKEQNKIKKLILDQKLDRLFEGLYNFNDRIAKNEFISYITNREEKEKDENNKNQYKIIKNLYNLVSPTFVIYINDIGVDLENGCDFHIGSGNMCKDFITPQSILDAMKILNLKKINTKYTELDIDNENGFLCERDNSNKNRIYNNIYGCIVPTIEDDYVNIIKKMNSIIKKVEKQDEKEDLNDKDLMNYNKFVVLFKDFKSDVFTLDDIRKIFGKHRIHLIKVDS